MVIALLIFNGLSFLSKIHPNADDKVIEHWLESNICRCTGYEEIEKCNKNQF